MRYPRRGSARTGVAVVELAVLLPVLMILLVGVWELGRLVQLHQIMSQAAREGARLASQAHIINTNGAYTQIAMNTGNPNVEETVRDHLRGAGITDLTGLQVTFEFLDGDTSKTEPYEGTKNQRFRVRVTLPYANVRWTHLSLVDPQIVGGECVWQMMVDDPFTLSTTLPGWSP